MKTGSRTTAKDIKGRIKACAASASNIAPDDAERRSRLFCAFLSNDFKTSDPSVYAVLQQVAGLDQEKPA